jgi:hypothetical protein
MEVGFEYGKWRINAQSSEEWWKLTEEFKTHLGM